MRPHTPITLLVLAGCGSEPESTFRLVEIDASTPMAIQLHDAVGQGTVAVPIRQTNSYGAAVSGGSISIAVRGGGSIAGSELSFDATGYATAFVNVPNGSIAEVQVQSASETDNIGPAANAFGLSAGLPALPLAPTTLLDVEDNDFIAPGTGGVAVASGDIVWWVPMEQGQPAHSVANLPFLIDGMWGTHIDRDGVLDLAIWADTQLVLLRGRSAGGYGWGGAWSAGDRDVAGVTATDVNGDRIADLVVGISSEEDSLVEVMLGDGHWGFEPTEALELSYPIEGVSASDDDRNGDPDITVLSGESGVLHRYTVTDEGWVGGTPPEIAQYKAEPGSLLLPPIDLNDAGAPEIAVIGPSSADAQELVFYVLGEPPTKYPLSFNPFYAAFADLDGDGADDLVALEENVVNAIRFTPDDDKFISQSTVGLGEAGPIAARDYTGDGLADLVILNNGVSLREGIEPSTGGWSVQTHSFRSYNLNLIGPISGGDLVGNGKVDVVGVTDDGDIPTVTGWWFVEGGDGPALQQAGAVPTQPGILLDYAHCDRNIYVLVLGAEGRSIHRIRINDAGGNFSLENKWDTPISTDADHLACGSATPSIFGVAAATSSGDWIMYKNDGTEASSGNAGATAGIVMADTDGDGADEVYACDVMDCTMLAVDFNRDGRDEIVSSGFDTRISSESGAQTMPSRGWLNATDINGDGRVDLTIFDGESGTYSIHQGMNNGLAPAVSIRTSREAIGPGFLSDVDRDGSLEFLTVAADGKLVHTRTGD
jgi:hypothetical protein